MDNAERSTFGVFEAVDEGEAAQDFADDRQAVLDRQSVAGLIRGAHHLIQVAPPDVLHRHVRHAVDHGLVEHFDDVRVFNPRHHLLFDVEHRQVILAPRRPRGGV